MTEMTPAEAVFFAAVALPPSERPAYLSRACAGRDDLRQLVERMLAAQQHVGDFLEHSPAASSDPVTATFGSPSAVSTTDFASRDEQAAVVIAGKYTLVEIIGEGGMGSVWRAKQTEPVKRFVAVKLIKAGMDSKQVLARFDAERQALALMDHPNIAKVLDGGLHNHRPYFVMELVKGVPITEYCDARKLTPQQRLELFVQVCQAIQHAHQKGIIHRDIKPSNVLIALYDEKPVVKVIDFGVAKATGGALTEQTLDTGFGGVVGTPQYMSPEQATFNNLDIDTRSDVYALGVLLYELLVGSSPFSGAELKKKGLLEMLRVVREEDPPRPSTKLSTADALPTLSANRSTEPKKLTGLLRNELDWIVMKALEKDRTRRYETANSFAADVLRYLSGEAVQAHPPSRRYRLKKFARRNKVQVIAASLVFAALLAGIAGTTFGLFRADAARVDAVNARAAEADRAEAELLAKQQALVEKQKAEVAEAHAIVERNKALEQKKRADDEAAIAKAVSDFLRLDLLSETAVANRPAVVGATRNPDVKVRELLDRAARKIDGKFGDQPLTEAAIRLTLGNTYLDLGLYEEARQQSDRALALRERTLGTDDLETLTVVNNLGLLYHHQSKFDLAEPLFNRVVEKRTAQQGADHLDTLTAMQNLAALYKDQGKLDRVEPLLQHILKHRTAKLGADNQHTLLVQYDLAVLYVAQAKYEQSQLLLQNLLERQSATLGADHHDTMATMSELAMVYSERGKYPQAEQLSKRVLELTTAVKGADHVDTLTAKDNLAKIYLDRKKYDLAEPLLTEVLTKRTALLGPDHRHTLTSEHNLASLYMDQQKYDQAEKLLQHVVEKRTSVYGAEHSETMAARANLATLLWRRGRYQQSVPLFEQLLRIDRRTSGDEQPSTILTAFNLAVNYRDAGRLAEAATTIEEWLPRGRAKQGMGHPATQFGVTTALSIYERTGAHANAEPLLRDLAAHSKGQHGADSLQYGSALASVGYILTKQNKYADAETILRECVAIYEAKQPESWPAFAIRSKLGETLLGQKKYADAEPLLLSSFEGLKQNEAKIPANFKYHITAGLERVVQLYVAWGKNDQANIWRKKLEAEKERSGPNSLSYATELAVLGLNLLQQKKWTDAEPVLRKCLAIREKKEPDAWRTFNTQSMLGGALLGQKKYEEAEPLLLKAYEELKAREKTIPPQAAIYISHALDRLIELYTATNKPDEVKKWQTERQKYSREQAPMPRVVK